MFLALKMGVSKTRKISEYVDIGRIADEFLNNKFVKWMTIE
jgi:hypothetical protein